MSIRLNFLKLILCSCPIMAGICVYYTGSSVGLSAIVQTIAWLIFTLSMPASMLTKPFYLERTPFLCFSLISSYLLLSLSYEAIFLPILCLAMALWSKIEDTQSQDVIKKNDHFGAFLRKQGHCSSKENGDNTGRFLHFIVHVCNILLVFCHW